MGKLITAPIPIGGPVLLLRLFIGQETGQVLDKAQQQTLQEGRKEYTFGKSRPYREEAPEPTSNIPAEAMMIISTPIGNGKRQTFYIARRVD